MRNSYRSKNYYLETGMLYEYSGAIKTSLKIYLISLKTFYIKSKLNGRLFYCCHWIDPFRKRSLNLIKNTNLKKWLEVDILSFLHKYYQYEGNFISALDFLKKCRHFINQKLSRDKILFKKFNFNIYIFNTILRLLILTNDKISESLNIGRLFYKIKKNLEIDKREFWLMSRIFYHFKNKFRVKNKFKNLPYIYKNYKNLPQIPYFIEITRNSNRYNIPRRNPVEQIKLYIALDIKKNLIENKRFTPQYTTILKIFLKQVKIFESFLIFSDSYCDFNRNLRIKLNLLLKFEKNISRFITKKLIIKIINYYSLLDSRNPYPYYLFLKMEQKLDLPGFILTPVLSNPSAKIKKKLVNFNKEYILKLNMATEELFEKKKWNNLLKISLILVLINFKLSLMFKNGENFKKIVFGDVFDKKESFNEENIYKGSNMMTLVNMNENVFLLHKILIFKLIGKKNISNNFIASKILEILASSKIFSKSTSFNLTPIFIILALKKKRYVKAYNLLRLQCSSTPYSVKSWRLLSLVEKEIGIAVSKTLRFALRVIGKFPRSIPGIIFAGNLCSVFGSSGYALAEFYQAYRWKNNSPFLNLSISIQYLNGSINRRNNLKGLLILLCLSFFFRYKILRYFTIQLILQENFYSDFLNLEILYNSGRILLFLGINSRANINFEVVFKHKKTVSNARKFNRNRKKRQELILQKEVLLSSLFLADCM